MHVRRSSVIVLVSVFAPVVAHVQAQRTLSEHPVLMTLPQSGEERATASRLLQITQRVCEGIYALGPFG